MKQDDIYELIEMECRKQLLSGEIKGTTAQIIGEKLCMQRPNVVREVKKLINSGVVHKVEGRPVYYYIDPQYIDLNKYTLDEKYILSNNIDEYLKNKKLNLMGKGFSNEEVKEKLSNEIEQYVNKYFTTQNKIDTTPNNEPGECVYILGVDGGGTKTETVAYSLDGKELARGYAGYGNIIIDKETGLKNLELSILQCISRLRKEDCKCLYLGLAGCEAGDNKIVIDRYLRSRFDCPIKIVNDGQLALSALLKGEDGILTIAGTGSITIGKNNGSEVRAGGWGHVIGDEGSGYYIALQGIKRVFLEHDLGLAESLLTKKIYKETNCNNIKQLLKFVYNSDKCQIAALVPAIAKMAKKGEVNSIEILRQSGKDLAKNTIRAINLLKVKGRVKVAIKGSILTEIPIVKEAFINELYLRDIRIELFDKDVPSAKGAYYEIIKELNKN